MTPLSQRAPIYKSHQLGTCPDTFGSSGCKLFSLCILYDLDPFKIDELFKETGVYENGCLINDQTAADVLGVTFEGKTKEYQNTVCLAETDNFAASGVPQHFFVWLGDSHIIDPLDGMLKTNKYNIVSFRLFREKKECPMTDKPMIISMLKDYLTFLYGTLYKYPLDEARVKIIEDQAEAIFNDNIRLAEFMKVNKPEFDSIFVRQTLCDKRVAELDKKLYEAENAFKAHTDLLKEQIRKYEDELTVCGVNLKTCQRDLAGKPVVCEEKAIDFELWSAITKKLLKNWLGIKS